jgi:flagellar motility protein MotE (MotC chaperone)
MTLRCPNICLQRPDQASIFFHLALAILALLLSPPVSAQTTPARASASSRENKEMQNLCANIAASIEAERLSRQQKALAEIEDQIKTKLAALEAKEKEVSGRIERLEAFEKKTDESLIAFYAGMKADAAAAQLSELDEDIAAGILLRLKTKSSSAILNEMQAERGAALIKRIGRLRQLADGKSP